MLPVLLAGSAALLLADTRDTQVAVSVIADTGADPRIEWGVGRLRAAIEDAGVRADRVIRVEVGDATLRPEGFALRSTDEGIRVTGADPAGAMYGCLELAQRIRHLRALPRALQVEDAPALSLRGTCILLMKLGTYDYPITPEEFPFFYDKRLWTEYLDFMAENRLNSLTFWNGHPFDYFVSLDRFPEAQDGLPPGLLARNHEMLQWLAAEAERRNIWLLFEFYNIHTSVYFQRAHGLPAWNPAPTPLLTDYTHYAIERFVSEFPNIGLYVCPGEALQSQYVVPWLRDVIFDAVLATGKTPPVVVRSWGITLDQMRELKDAYPRLYTERKYNVEMIAGAAVDPENRDWAEVTGRHVVNVHCMGNLEPFRWSPPSYIQECLTSAIGEGGATGLHLYPRKAWRWPYGCEVGHERELQWDRDWMWYEAWARYAWNPCRPPAAEAHYWLDRLSARYGPGAAPHILRALEQSADILPAIQRLLWLGNDNHTVVSAGLLLSQAPKAAGAPFIADVGAIRIPEYIQALCEGRKPEGRAPVALLAAKVEEAKSALQEAHFGANFADHHKEEAARLTTDIAAMAWVARFYKEKVDAGIAKALCDAGIRPAENARKCLTSLRASVGDFRQLAKLTADAYESISDVPAWNPTQQLPCPYHWSDILPLYEGELQEVEQELAQIAAAHEPEPPRGRAPSRSRRPRDDGRQRSLPLDD